RGWVASQLHGHLCPKTVKRPHRSPHMRSTEPPMSSLAPSNASETSRSTPSTAPQGAPGGLHGSPLPLNAQGGGARSGALQSRVSGGSVLTVSPGRATSARSPPPPESSSLPS